MDPYAAQPIRRSVAGAVRSNAIWAAISAALFYWFGYYGAGTPLEEGTVFAYGAWTLIYTLRIFCIVFAVIAALCLTGEPWVLLVDGIASLLAGFGLLLSGVMEMSGGGGMNSMLIVIFGVVFMAAGKRLFGEYQTLMLLSNQAGAVAGDDRRPPAPPFEGRGVPAPIGPPPDELTPAHAVPEPDDGNDSGHSTQKLRDKLRDNLPAAPEGFLASFADDQDDESDGKKHDDERW